MLDTYHSGTFSGASHLYGICICMIFQLQGATLTTLGHSLVRRTAWRARCTRGRARSPGHGRGHDNVHDNVHDDMNMHVITCSRGEIPFRQM